MAQFIFLIFSLLRFRLLVSLPLLKAIPHQGTLGQTSKIPVHPMMAITHACIAAAGASLLFSSADPLTLGLAVLGSQLPDIDTTTSIIGQIAFPVSSWIEDRFPHRSVTHSLIATVTIAILSLAIGYVLGDKFILMPLPLGHLLSCFSDTFTRQGVQLFWPVPAWAVCGLNPNRRLRTGGTGEYPVLAAACGLLILGIYLAGVGGLTSSVGQGLGLRDSAIAMYSKNAEEHIVYAEVKGTWANDQSRADGRYTIIAADGNEFVIADGKGLYRTNSQIIIEKLTTNIGPQSATITQLINFSDELPADKLNQLQAAYPDKQIYLTGAVALDFAEQLRLPIDSRQFDSQNLNGEVLTYDFHPLERAVLELREQYVIGTLEAKIVSVD